MDRAALDAALEQNISCGGWCPRGRRAEDGIISSIYPLAETPSGQYEQRTEWNVRDSDGTLILARGAVTGGTALTLSLARKLGKPCLVIDLSDEPDVESVLTWLGKIGIRVLNVAGPRESQKQGIYLQALTFLTSLFGREV